MQVQHWQSEGKKISDFLEKCSMKFTLIRIVCFIFFFLSLPKHIRWKKIIRFSRTIIIHVTESSRCIIYCPSTHYFSSISTFPCCFFFLPFFTILEILHYILVDLQKVRYRECACTEKFIGIDGWYVPFFLLLLSFVFLVCAIKSLKL